MFQFDKQTLYIPLVGPFSFKNLTFYSYEIKPKNRIDDRNNFTSFKAKVKDYFISQDKYSIQDEDLLISIKEIIQDPQKTIDGQSFTLEKKETPSIKFSNYLGKFIQQIFQNLIEPTLTYKMNQVFILEREKISESTVKELKIELFRHKAIRYSYYIDFEAKQFCILLYPSYKLVIEPTVEQFILKDIDITELSVISKKLDYPTGDVIEVVKKPDALIKQEINKLNREIKKESEKISVNDPLIKLKSMRKSRDQYYPAKFFNIQAKMNDEIFEEDFDWNLGDIQGALQFDPDGFYKSIEPLRQKFQDSVKKYLEVKEEN